MFFHLLQSLPSFLSSDSVASLSLTELGDSKISSDLALQEVPRMKRASFVFSLSALACWCTMTVGLPAFLELPGLMCLNLKWVAVLLGAAVQNKGFSVGRTAPVLKGCPMRWCTDGYCALCLH